MRSYPIWNKVTACIYGSSKSFGAKDDSGIEILVGNGANNSHLFVEINTKKIVLDDVVVFKFYVDGIKVKEAVFKNEKGRAVGEPKMEFFNNFMIPKNV
jgi:hypothetical protein